MEQTAELQSATTAGPALPQLNMQVASPELTAALAALEEAETELTVQRTSIGTQLGTHLVEMARQMRSPTGFVKQLPVFALSTWELLSLSRIDASMFVSLPPQNRPGISFAGTKQARLAWQLARHTANFIPGEVTELAISRIAASSKAEWLKARAINALELARHARVGFPLPDKAAHAASTNRRVTYIVRDDPLRVANGYTRRTHEIVVGLSNLGWIVDPIVTPRAGRGELTVCYDGVLYHRLATSTGYGQGLAGYVNEFADAIVARAAITKPALIHAASNYINGLAGAIAARRLGLPFVYEVRGLWELTRLTIREDAATTLGFHAQSCLEAQAAEAADRVLVLSDELGAELERRGLPAGRTRLAASGSPVMQPVTDEARTEARRSFDIAPNTFAVGYIGSLLSYEGLDVLIKAVAKAGARDPRVRLLVIGDGYLREDLERLTRRLGIADRVRFTGRIDPHLAKKAYAAIDLAAYPRKRLRVTEVVPPLKHLEAAASGIPVIVSDVAPLRTFAQRTHAAVMFPADDIDALANAIIDLASSPVRLSEMSKAGLAAARAQTWQTTARAVVDTYSELLG